MTNKEREKITVYELLGMIKDGKVMPERIKFENYIYIWRNPQKDYFCEEINHSLESIIGEYLFSSLNLEVEILEYSKENTYKLRNEKAIESIKSLIIFLKKYSPDNTLEIEWLEDVLSVLQGSD